MFSCSIFLGFYNNYAKGNTGKSCKRNKKQRFNSNPNSQKVGNKTTYGRSIYISRTMPALDTFANICVLLDVYPADILCINKKD